MMESKDMHPSIEEVLAGMDRAVEENPMDLPTKSRFGKAVTRVGGLTPYVLIDNAGYFTLSKEDVSLLGRSGYVAHEDVLYHPDHWEPTDEDYMNPGVIYGLDGKVKARTTAAMNWGKNHRLW